MLIICFISLLLLNFKIIETYHNVYNTLKYPVYKHNYIKQSLHTQRNKHVNNHILKDTNTNKEVIEPAIYNTDFYGVLGITKNASRIEVKNAYWGIASRNHPDRNKVYIYILK